MKNKTVVALPIAILCFSVLWLYYNIASNHNTNVLTREQLILSVDADETKFAFGIVNKVQPGGISVIPDEQNYRLREEIGFYRVFDTTNSDNSIVRRVVLYELENNPWRTYYFKVVKNTGRYYLVDILNH
jgi:hypothetical protein